jgi:hypothetical protein
MGEYQKVKSCKSLNPANPDSDKFSPSKLAFTR